MSPSFSLMLILLLPLAGFLLPALIGNRFSNRLAAAWGVLMSAGAALIALWNAYGYFFSQPTSASIAWDISWMQMGNLSIHLGIMRDSLSMMMLVVVTFVSLMVNIFSTAYMKGETRARVYFSFLSLFSFSMLGLVVSSNIFQMYIFWELVGVSSFLLIGFYYDKTSAMQAARKAFIVTRFADLGFLIGILIVGNLAGSYDFPSIISTLTAPENLGKFTTSFMGVSALTWALCLIFMGGAGKSAMFPLHIWLPDAMEGPTPVSALIHAATMVVAGVFLVARMFPVFAIASPISLHLVAYVGLFSAAFAAIIACTQSDIKRVLAYSTMSQIGFMMFALGFASYGGESGRGFMASLFHLFTHAGFKALLFLGAGMVIHYVHSNEMSHMGGLRKQMPITHLSFLLACLAISGIPPFAGFFSKEEILLSVYHRNPSAYYIALATSGLTAFYMFRLYYNIFWSRPMDPNHSHHGEGGFAMKLPLILLSLITMFAGFIPFGQYLSSDGKGLSLQFHPLFSIAPVSIAILGILLATRLYKTKNETPDRWTVALNELYVVAKNKFYIDEIYLFVTRKVLYGMVARSIAWLDRNVIDGAVRGAGTAMQGISLAIKGMQSGRLQQYGMWILWTVLLLMSFVVYRSLV